MRLSNLIGKELINLADGSKLGPVRKIDFVLDLKAAKLKSMIVPGKGFFFRTEQEILWTAVKKISEDLVLWEDVTQELKEKTID
ncbi:MAG: YlmC/YmxH family sporulation protein [Firmicutes bacterium]|nr:YlmC/YmxH family sporulation protein [Bacillota bacterium]